MNKFAQITKKLLTIVGTLGVLSTTLPADTQKCEKCMEYVAKAANYYNANKCDIISQTPDYKYRTYMYLVAEKKMHCSCMTNK